MSIIILYLYTQRASKVQYNVNNCLKRKNPDSFNNIVNLIYDSIKINTEEIIKVYRGTSLHDLEIDDYKNLRTCPKWFGFVSASMLLSIAKKFALRHACRHKKKPVIFEITVYDRENIYPLHNIIPKNSEGEVIIIPYGVFSQGVEICAGGITKINMIVS